MVNLKGYAHLGDALWDVVVRKKIIQATTKLTMMHKLTVKYVNAKFQAQLLEFLLESLDEKEQDLARRAKNIQINSARKVDKSLHRLATAFEAILGYLYLNNKPKYLQVIHRLETKLD